MDLTSHDDSRLSPSLTCIMQPLRSIFVCFNCGIFVAGFGCYQHHCKTCVRASRTLRQVGPCRAFGTRMPSFSYCGELSFVSFGNLKWTECAYCDQQQAFALHKNRQLIKKTLSCLMRWSRLLLVCRSRHYQTLAWRQTSSNLRISMIDADLTIYCLTFL